MKLFGSTFFSGKATALFAAITSIVSALPPPPPTLYVSVNGGTGTILQVTSGNVVNTIASNLGTPTGLAFGPNGNLYVAQVNSGAIPSQISQVTIPGNGVSAFASGLQVPVGLAFNTSGVLFVADYNASPNRIATVGSGGGGVSTFAIGSVASGAISPFGLAFNASGTLFVANRDANTISQVATNGTVTSFATGFSSPNGLAFDNNGNLYVANFAANTISKVTSGGSVTTFVDNTNGLSSPVGLAFDPVTGSLFVANQGAGSIFEVKNLSNLTGTVSTFATGLGGVQYLAISAVPEPSTYAAIAGAAMLGFAFWRRRRATSAATLAVDAAA